ncbi:beta-CASP ribonuclease aCPSF1 [Candidatus Aenigmatarchaeota archaeon]
MICIKILEEVKKSLPADANISEIVYEGSEIILYTKSEDFFRNNIGLIKKIVGKIKKRIEVRADPSIVRDAEETKEVIKKVVPKDAGIKDIYFEPQFAKVVIHAEKPGLVIGKSGETLISIKDKTFWTPDIKRAPVIDSEIIRSIRKMLHKEAATRKKSLNKLGQKIYTPGKSVDWVRLSCLGAFRDIGRSCMLVQTPESRVMLDCGIGVGNNRHPFPYLEAPEFNIQDLDAVIISHSHLDHCGFLPYLYEYGYKGPVYCTRPVRDLMALMQLDYLGICQRENKKAPYSSKSIENAIKHCITLDYGEVTDISPDIRITLQNAGHLLGSSLVHLHIGNGLYNLLYTADFKYEDTLLFDKASTDFARVEALVIESTYGAPSQVLPDHRQGDQHLVETVKKTISNGGRVLIPSFAVGRGQDVISILTKSDIDVPIYLEGMIWDATAIHTAYPEFMSKYIQNKILHKGENPFTDPRIRGIGSVKERREILETTHPAVVVATSGMLIGGPAIEYLQHFAPDKKNTIAFVGYQCEGTLGRRIQKGWNQVQLDNGKSFEMKMGVTTISGLGGHSDFNQLMNFVRNLRTKPKKIIVNHGDNERCTGMARAFHQNFKTETLAPKLLDAIRLR